MPVDVENRAMRLERHPCTKIAAQPASPGVPAPVDGVLGACLLAPSPSFLVPQLPPVIATVVHECSELGLGDGSARNCKGPDPDRVGPLFVVKDEPETELAVGRGSSRPVHRLLVRRTGPE